MRDIINVDGREFDNVSLDKEVGFIEDSHTYVMVKDPNFKFTSVTTYLKQFESEEFISETQAKECNCNKNSKYYNMGVENILARWKLASDIGTLLHNYGEKLLNGQPAEAPDDRRARYVPILINELWSKGYQLAITEILLYSEHLELAGQSDILLKKKIKGTENFSYMVYDFKFLSEPIKKKSFYNRKTRKFKQMLGPFKYLNDCNWIHYSIQLAMYQTLTGDPAMITEKVLIVVTDDGYEFVPCYPMRVFWDENDKLQAIYEVWNGKWYDSRVDSLLNTKPTDIVGL